VTYLDLAMVGIPALLGGTLLGRLLVRIFRGRSPSGISMAYRAWHARLQESLLGRNLLRFPGSCLVDSIRPWILGESVFLLLLLASVAAGDDRASFLLAVPVAAPLATGVILVSLRNEGKRALSGVQRDLPAACFLLSLLLESGMGPSAALQELGAAIPQGVLSREIGALIRARTLGVPRQDSLECSRQRVPLQEYHLFLNHVKQGERLGIGLSRSLRELSGNLLESQAHRAETVAQQAGVKMLAPLVLFIFPAVFLIILSPVLLGLWRYLWG